MAGWSGRSQSLSFHVRWLLLCVAEQVGAWSIAAGQAGWKDRPSLAAAGEGGRGGRRNFSGKLTICMKPAGAHEVDLVIVDG